MYNDAKLEAYGLRLGGSMTALETERLLIRNFASGDWEALHEIIFQYEASELAAYDQQG